MISQFIDLPRREWCVGEIENGSATCRAEKSNPPSWVFSITPPSKSVCFIADTRSSTLKTLKLLCHQVYNSTPCGFAYKVSFAVDPQNEWLQ